MTELKRIREELEKSINSMKENGIQTEMVSLTLISRSLISIAEELAIMNDRAAESED